MMDERERLTKAYYSNKLSHAYLFEGDDGQKMQQVAIDAVFEKINTF